jgi:N-acetylglutamate synthase-like GNAT family acetyltransferase|tara:strand:+ start:337 stop:756 length:420 start_codon:yes stop_codon:yes gene_type:complete
MLRKAGVEDLNSINRVIELCLYNRPVTERIKKLTLSSLLFESTDLNYMAIWVVGEPATGVLGLQKIDEGMLLHSIYVDPSKSNQGVGTELFRHARQLTANNNQDRLIVKSFSESVGFFKKIGFTPSYILDYPHTLEIVV